MKSTSEQFDGVKCTAETTKAILCIVDGTEVWIPKSVVDDDSEVSSKDDEGLLIVAEWFARKQGWI